MRQYGMSIGTAYQVYDDCLDLFGSEAVVGKSLGTDMAKGKLTLPVLLALERASVVERERIKAMVVDWKPEFLPEMVGLLQKHQTLEESQNAVTGHLGLARAQLKSLPDSESAAGLSALADYLAYQPASLGVRG